MRKKAEKRLPEQRGLLYDADKKIMLKKILQYPLETRFKYGLPITTGERETLKLKLTCLKEI